MSLILEKYEHFLNYWLHWTEKKIKLKIFCFTPWGRMKWWRYSSTHSERLCWFEVGGQLHVMVANFLGEKPSLLMEDEACRAPRRAWTFRGTEKSLFFFGNRTTIPRTSTLYDWLILGRCKYKLNLRVAAFQCVVDEYWHLLGYDALPTGN
jgi:hypothetical protein